MLEWLATVCVGPVHVVVKDRQYQVDTESLDKQKSARHDHTGVGLAREILEDEEEAKVL